jgi:hypothetical protein
MQCAMPNVSDAIGASLLPHLSRSHSIKYSSQPSSIVPSSVRYRLTLVATRIGAIKLTSVRINATVYGISVDEVWTDELHGPSRRVVARNIGAQYTDRVVGADRSCISTRETYHAASVQGEDSGAALGVSSCIRAEVYPIILVAVGAKGAEAGRELDFGLDVEVAR